MTTQVLLLLENRATGGVTTVATTLAQSLRRQGSTVAEVVVRNAAWRSLWSALRGCDVVLASHNFAPAYIGWLLASLGRKPLVVWVHGPVAEVLAQAGTGPLKRRALRWFYRMLPTCVFVSQASMQSLAGFLGRPPPSTWSVIPNAVPHPVASTLRQPRDRDRVELAYVGRLSAEKRPLLLLDVMRLLPARFHLTVVGDGPLREELTRSGADLLASGRLALAGERKLDADSYRHWHLTLLVSRYEGCPMSLLESLACGIPCVAVPIASVREVLELEAPCLVASDDSAQAIADAVQRVVKLSPERLAAQMARVLQRHGVDEFGRSWQGVLDRTAPC